MKEEYKIEEVAGTLFLKFGNLVLASNIGEQGNVTDEVRRHFNNLVARANEPPTAPTSESAVDVLPPS